VGPLAETTVPAAKTRRVCVQVLLAAE
jgi:hypothetical protein